MCRRDLLFHVTLLAFVYDPRATAAPVTPFVPYPFQVEVMQKVQESIVTQKDLHVEKSRDQGATWLILMVFEHLWHWHRWLSFLLISRKEDLVESEIDSDALFWKLDHLLDHMPDWALPAGYDPHNPKHRQEKTMFNPATHSTITGESTAKGSGAGGRKTAVMVDEAGKIEPPVSMALMESLTATTGCRIWNSTPQGAIGAFYAMREILPPSQRVSLHWSKHPEQGRGLYRGMHGKVERLDAKYEHPRGYKFVLDGKLRSPFYDALKFPPSVIASQYDIDYLGSGSPLFDPRLIEELLSETVMPPFKTGELSFHPDTLEPIRFTENPEGRLQLWCVLDAQGRPDPTQDYCIGVDIAAGTGASNSAVSIVNRGTGEKVGAFIDSRIRPHQLAHMCVAIAGFFGGIYGPAFMIWEANGHGRPFGAEVVSKGFRRIYFRVNTRPIGGKGTDEPGWYSSKDTKKTLLVDYNQSLFERRFINHCRSSLVEAQRYVHNSTGGVEFSGMSEDDPSGAGENHGDRVIADALCCMLASGVEVELQPELNRPATPPPCSFAWRRERAREQERLLHARHLHWQ